MIFVDTGAWTAYASADDIYHVIVTNWFQRNREPLFTTDYVFDEALTLLRARGKSNRANYLGNLLLRPSFATLHYLATADIMAGWEIFRRYSDKEWSFTDCTSKAVIERLGITQALSFDHHFRQFGTVTVLP